MQGDRYAQYGAATGILAAILMVVGFGVFGSIPASDASAPEWRSFYIDNQTQVQIGATIAALGVFALLWFLGSLRSAIALAEGGSGRLASIAFGGGIACAAFFIIGLTAFETAAYRPEVT